MWEIEVNIFTMEKTDEAEALGGTVRFLLLDESDSAGATVPSVMGTPLMPPSPPAGVDRVCVRGVEADMFSESEVKALYREPVT